MSNNFEMTKTLIIEDEDHCMERLTDLLSRQSIMDLEITGKHRNIDSAFQALMETKPDLVFLDIQVGQKTGFDLLQKIQNPGFHVIFTTAYEAYALKAIKFSALDYLLKPIEESELLAALEKFQREQSKSQQLQRIESLLINLRTPRKKLSIPTLSGLQLLEISEIIRAQADVNYTYIFLKNGQKITVSKTLKEIEDWLAGHNFFRVHHTHLVNLHEVTSYQKGKGGSLILSNHEEIEVSIRRKEELLSTLKRI